MTTLVERPFSWCSRGDASVRLDIASSEHHHVALPDQQPPPRILTNCPYLLERCYKLCRCPPDPPRSSTPDSAHGSSLRGPVSTPGRSVPEAAHKARPRRRKPKRKAANRKVYSTDSPQRGDIYIYYVCVFVQIHTRICVCVCV